MLKDINLDLDIITNNHYDRKPVGVVENTVCRLNLNELQNEIELEAHKLTYTAETISAIENSIITSIESGKIVVSDVIKIISDAVNNVNNETIIDITYDGLVIGRENYIYLEGIMDRIKKAAKAIWEKIKAIMKKIIDFFKNLLNKIFGSASSGGGGGGVSTSVLDKEESKSLNKLVELINEGDKDKLTSYVNKYYGYYKELLLKLIEHNDKINLGITIKGSKIHINYLEIKNFKAFSELTIETKPSTTSKHLNAIKKSVKYLNKNRDTKLVKSVGDSTYDITSKTLMDTIKAYNKRLDILARKMSISDIVNAEGSVVGINLKKLTLKNYTLMVSELSNAIVTCSELVESGKTVIEGKDLTEVVVKKDVDNLEKCIKENVTKSMIKDINITGNKDNDIDVRQLDSFYLFNNVTLDTVSYLKAVNDKFYSGSRTPSRIEGIGIIGLLFTHLDVEEVSDEKEPLDRIKLIFNLVIDLNKNVETHFENIITTLSKANGAVNKLKKIFGKLEISVREITDLVTKTDTNLKKLEKSSEDSIVKLTSTITKNIIEPLKNTAKLVNTISNVYEVEKEKVPYFFNRYKVLLDRIYNLALVMKALEVINKGK